MSSTFDVNERPDYDHVLKAIADYVLTYQVESAEALNTARLCLMDTLGCGLLALRFPECTKLLGPIVEGTIVPQGARVPGTPYRLDPVKAAWDIGCMVRWLDYNDTWLAAEWGHPSDNLGAILAVSDHLSQRRLAEGKAPMTMRQVLDAMVMAHEIQGVMALENSFNRVGLDHVVLVKVASTAVAAGLMGAGRDRLLSALSHAWVDGQALRTYRHAPNAGSRKSWAAGDASARGVQLALIAMRGEMGVPSVLTAPQWGFYDVLFSKTCRDQSIKPAGDRQFSMPQPFGCYVMENVLFKVAFPAEFHAQTAAEAGVKLHPRVRDRLDDIERIVISTNESAIRIISKVGPLANAADRDHCLQYITAVSLIFGGLEAEHYEDDFHDAHPEIDKLRDKMEIEEDSRYSCEYMEPDKRSIASAVEVFFQGGERTGKVAVEYPIGHRRRRKEAIPLLEQKFLRNLATCFSSGRCDDIYSLLQDQRAFECVSVNEFTQLLAR